MNAGHDGMRSLMAVLPVHTKRAPERAARYAAPEKKPQRSPEEAAAERMELENLAAGFVGAAMKKAPAADVYDWIIRLVEKPLLQALALECEGNQSEMARRLTLNRSTLAKRINLHSTKITQAKRVDLHAQKVQP